MAKKNDRSNTRFTDPQRKLINKIITVALVSFLFFIFYFFYFVNFVYRLNGRRVEFKGIYDLVVDL